MAEPSRVWAGTAAVSAARASARVASLLIMLFHYILLPTNQLTPWVSTTALPPSLSEII
jgi:hypothetical protein